MTCGDSLRCCLYINALINHNQVNADHLHKTAVTRILTFLPPALVNHTNYNTISVQQIL